jgi:hypothetical protein
MKPETKTLCTYLGGSHLYHLHTAESDVDERGVFMHLETAYILGTKRFDEERVQPVDGDEDKVIKELSHFCNLVRKSNSEAMEVLFCKEDEFEFLSDEFKRFRDYRLQFVSSKALFSCLRGYMQGEKRLANGERKGKIGGKRHRQLQAVGFSPKNFTQLFRLAHVGINFFKTGEYIVDTRDFPNEVHSFLMSVKTTPEKHTVEQLNEHATELEKDLVYSFENRVINNKFDEALMNKLLLELYFPVLEKSHKHRLDI